jgi:uncharacterized damage-inducible protein DinB
MSSPVDSVEESVPERHSVATQHPDMWVDPADDPRSEGSGSSDERSILIEYLADYRLTLRMKCDGLDAEQLARRSVPPSTLSLLGLVRHMAKVEHSWFRRVMEGVAADRLYWSEDDRDKDFNDAVADPDMVEDAWATWQAEIANAERFVDEADDLGMMDPKGEISLREVMVHMIEEYARHCGHADLLRERIDGRVGQ